LVICFSTESPASSGIATNCLTVPSPNCYPIKLLLRRYSNIILHPRSLFTRRVPRPARDRLTPPTNTQIVNGLREPNEIHIASC
jgi:hypothetical protein